MRLALLNNFELRQDGRLVPVPMSSARLVAFVALHDRPLRRAYVAGCLWRDVSETHATASLRTALWRVRSAGSRVLQPTANLLSLDPDTEVDVRRAVVTARQALARRAGSASVDIAELCRAHELLPDWYDDWVLIERERFRQLRLHALESLCESLAAEGRFAEAIEAGTAALADDPLRESAHRALIKAHLIEGNAAEAIRQYRFFRRLLRAELGLAPSPEIRRLIPVHRVSGAARRGP
jgi:DNA-binding SARP family transcriptional activator